ncbi:quinolinate synthase NadA [Methanococcoides methylutens]|uniref:Quinolinate synthase n=1 Tax=Methanococcoides methylutens MM1 TaxID=1434104 RepID=A0A0E3X0U5_METMT|nr:quinolinate synthase NadA [Methanococcoides methylutens]AKB86214.1 Quinolinate synthetase [Methanococcoides methylutens MM1]
MKNEKSSDHMQDRQTIINKIKSLKKERNAVILAHCYARNEVQDIADFVGDSLGLSQEAVDQDADVIVFCGVSFMAESAAVLSPEKTVLMPDADANCPMAAMVDVPSLREMKKEHPDAMVVCYVNTRADVKAESDICCTSANAVEVVNSLDADEIIFVPDKNLAAYVAEHTDKKIIPWNGYCPVHNQILEEDVILAANDHPDAEILAHPECRSKVLEDSDHVFSTTGMLNYVKDSSCNEFIISTEQGIMHQLEVENPEKKFYPVSKFAFCSDMKMINLEAVLRSLESMEHVVTVPEDIRLGAKRSLDRMLEVRRSR